MTDVVLTHAFVSPKPASADPTKIDGPKWNAAELFSAGSRGDQLVRQTTSATGAAWLAPESIDVRIYGALGDGVADDTAAIQAAYAAIPVTGGRLVFPPRSSGLTTYRFNQTLAITGKTVVVDGLTATTDNAGPHGAVTLEWFGGATPAITVSGTAASGSKLSGFRLNNTGTATVGIDIDGIGMVALSEVSLAAPTVPFSEAGIRIGNTANTTNLHFDRLVVQAAAPIGVQIIRLGAHAVFTKCTLIASSVCNLVLGTATTSALSVHFIGSSFDIGTNLDAVSVIYAQNVTFTDSYFEFGGTGHAIRIPATAQVATGLDVKGTWFTCDVGGAALSAIRSDFAATIGKVSGCFVAGLANPGYLFQNGGCQSLIAVGCHLNSAGTAIADVMTNVTALANIVGGSGVPQSDLGTLQALALDKSQNAGTVFKVTNTHAGTGAFAEGALIALGSSLTSYGFGTNYTTAGRFVQGSALVDADGPGGLGLAASHGAGVIRFYTNGDNERARIDVLGNLGLGTLSPSARLTVDKSAIAAVSTDGGLIQNATAATSGVPVQQSPRLRFRANVWNTTTPATNTNDWWVESVPASGATPFGQLKFGSSLNGAATTFPMTLNSVGTLTLLGGVTAGADVATAAGAGYAVSARWYMYGPGSGLVNLTNSAITSGIGFDLGTDAVLKIRTRAQTAYATLDCLGLKASGVAGANFGPAAPASITIVNGIVTAAS